MSVSGSMSHSDTMKQSSSDVNSGVVTSSSNRCASHDRFRPRLSERPTAVKLFVCSTGKDMENEESALIRQVFSKLREYCRCKHRLEFHAVNLRWAERVSLIGDDHHLMSRICMDAIDECTAQSAGPSFLALVGQRYGTCPLPAYIRVHDYDVIRSAVARKPSRKLREYVSLLDDCYELDCNELDQGHYRLKRQFNEDAEDTNAADQLRRVIDHGISIGLQERQLTAADAARYMLSEFDLELRHGVGSGSTCSAASRPSNRCLAFRRVIADLKNHAELPLVGERFAEVSSCADDPNRKHLDSTCEQRIEVLIDEVLPVAIGRENVVSRSVLWWHEDGINLEHHSDYIDEMCRKIHDTLATMIDRSRSTEAIPDNVDNELDLEVEQHRKLAMTEVEGFQGQEEALELVRSYLVSDNQEPLGVFGEMGAGKTALIAKAFVEASRWVEKRRLLNIVRFANGTSLSRDTRHVLSTICAELHSSLKQFGHQQLGHQKLGHQQLGHKQLGHQQSGHQQLGHQKLGHQKLGHQQLGHQKLGHQQLGHQQLGLRPPHKLMTAEDISVSRDTRHVLSTICAELHSSVKQLGHQQLGHQQLGHQQLGHKQLGHQQLGHQQLGHQQLGHQQLGHQQLGHQQSGHRQGHQQLGHQHLGHQQLGHQQLGHQQLGHQQSGHRQGHQQLGHQHLGHQQLGHQQLGHQQLGHQPPHELMTAGDISAYVSLGYHELVETFHRLLDNIPEGLKLLIFVDGVDLLFSEDVVRFDWIPKFLKEHVKLVFGVSKNDCHLMPLKPDVISSTNNFVELKVMSQSECVHLLIRELSARYHRCLTNNQLCHVVEKCFLHGAVPLYVKLIAAVVHTWTSSECSDDYALPATVEAAVETILERVEAKLGRALVVRVLGLLTASKHGLSDAEMDDVLSLDDNAFDALPDQGARLSVRRMPSLVWYTVKHLLHSYGWLTIRLRHGTLVNQWSHEKLAMFVGRRYMSSSCAERQFHSVLADYLLGRWSGVSKPVSRREVDGERSYDRHVPSQPILIHGPNGSRHNLWKLDRLPVHLHRSNRRNELNVEVLFNFEWIYQKSIAFGYDSVVDDYRLSTDVDVRLVEVALLQSRAHVGERLQNISVELTGLLLPYVAIHPNIQRLILDCDRRGPKLCAVVPKFPYIRPPGGPLQYSIELNLGHSVHRSHAMQFALIGEPGRQLLLAKNPTQAELRFFDPITGDRKPDLVTSVGDLYASKSGKFAAMVDFERERSVKIHRLDVKKSAPPIVPRDEISDEHSKFIGHLVPSRFIGVPSRDRHQLSHLCIVDDLRLCLGVESTSDSRSWLVVGTSTSADVIYTASYRGRLTCCQPWRPDRRGVAYVGVERTLYAYQLIPDVRQISQTNLPDVVRLIVFTKNGERGYAIGDRTDSLTVLSLAAATIDVVATETRSDVQGRVEAVTSIDLKVNNNVQPSHESSRTDSNNNVNSFQDIEISNSDELLLIRSRRSLVVYNIRREKLVKVIQRPCDVPVEFRFPNSGGRFTPIDFTQSHFTPDSKFIVASIFRDIHIYHAEFGFHCSTELSAVTGSRSESPLTILRAPIGIVSDLFVISGRGPNRHQVQLVSIANADSAPLVDVWNIDVAMTTSKEAIVDSLRDRLTSSIRDVRLAGCNSSAFVSTMKGDEIGVYDMSTGQLVDLMTHESVVAQWCVLPDGRHVLVSLEQAKPGQFNKIWNVKRRRIVHEFGDVKVHSVALEKSDGFLVLGQTDGSSVSDSFHLQLFRITENDTVLPIQLNFDLPYVLNVPFMTPFDRYLIVFHASDYDQTSAEYLVPKICALTLHNESNSSPVEQLEFDSNPDVISWATRSTVDTIRATTFSPEDLRSLGVPAVKRMLQIRPCPTNSYTVVVLYANEESNRDDQDRWRSQSDVDVEPTASTLEGSKPSDQGDCLAPHRVGYERPYGFLVLDVRSGVVRQVTEDCLPTSIHFDRLLSTSDHHLYVDQSSNIYNMATGCCIGENVFQSDSIQLQQFAVNDQILIGVDKCGYLRCLRLADGQLIADLCVHGDVTALCVSNRSRVVVIGCSDGSVLSYVIIDHLTDTEADRDALISTLASRQRRPPGGGEEFSTPKRAWDKVDGVAPSYSRPPSAVIPVGPSDKQTLRTLEPDLVLSAYRRMTSSRSASGSAQLYHQLSACRSQTCAVM